MDQEEGSSALCDVTNSSTPEVSDSARKKRKKIKEKESSVLLSYSALDPVGKETLRLATKADRQLRADYMSGLDTASSSSSSSGYASKAS